MRPMLLAVLAVLTACDVCYENHARNVDFASAALGVQTVVHVNGAGSSLATRPPGALAASDPLVLRLFTPGGAASQWTANGGSANEPAITAVAVADGGVLDVSLLLPSNAATGNWLLQTWPDGRSNCGLFFGTTITAQ